MTAIESKFPRTAYFLAWNDGWSPITNKNAWALFNHNRVINRGKINLDGGSGSGGGTSPSTGTILYNFSNGVGEWKGTNIKGGPWQTNEFVVKSTDAIKGDIELRGGGRYTLYTQQKSTMRVAQGRRLIARARVATWGFTNGGTITAKLYIKAGSSWKWYDSGSVQLNSSTSTPIILDLTKISASELADVNEIGVEYTSNTNGGLSAVYLSHITVE
jgi:mannan endo-1,4-beta-mannosidase